ncbi:type IV secretory system conjugative DNA transfer family protein [Reichenbachiella sp. MALMAid0571]|uniref:type IV secretory system conjugative DNA transfer family protein n=1 Tax=Reichenbachiella sp. MALMAid0571 TaxID=3143939 RepID=UPI0032E03701
MKLFGSKESKSHEALLDSSLYKVPGTNTVITWADAVEGTLITGATGSGKSSGAGKHIAHAMLKSKFGMCILCAKKDERNRWLAYIKEAAPERMKDLVIFNKESGLHFNLLQYEMERIGEGSGDVLNAVEALMSLNEQNRVYLSGGGGGKDERFWDLSLRRLISRCISTLRLAGEEVSITNMRKLVTDCFKDDEPDYYQKLELQATNKGGDPQQRKQATDELESWIETSYFLQVLLKISDKEFNTSDSEELELAMNYWIKEFPKIGEKATSIIVESFMGIVEPFLNKGILKDQFAKGLSPDLLPENIYKEARIVLIDFPVKEFGIAGIYAATIFKTTFQAAMERRDIETENNPRPVGLWIDEYQQFCTHKTDSQFQATARSSWVATVYITQNINNIFYVMGNDQPEAKTKSLLGNLNLKFFASNDNYDTNVWASNMIGKHLVDFQNLSFSKDMEISKTKNQQMQFRISPDHFTILKTGRKGNDYIVETIVFKSGKTWDRNGRNFALVGFKQR